MDVLVVGSGGREHAICHGLRKSPETGKIWCVPGNPGIASIAECVKLESDSPDSLAAFAKEKGVALAVIGPEAPLCAGAADAIRAAGIPVFGPVKASAQLEGSKDFSKKFMVKYGIPTARYETFEAAAPAHEYIRSEYAASRAVVVKADGLAAGKGVVVASCENDAHQAVDECFAGHFGAAGAKVVIEELLIGEEASILALTDGKTIVPLVSSQDHKRQLDGDKGPNTGGMGAYSPAPVVTESVMNEVTENVLKPFLKGIQTEGLDYRGIIYAGIMVTKTGSKVLEFNVRFGDPETEAVLPRLKSSLFDVMMKTAQQRLDEAELVWSEEPSVCIVMASGGYPAGPLDKGHPISGIAEAEKTGAVVYHAGTALKDGVLVNNGGRVLTVTRTAPTVREAIDGAYEAVSKISWSGEQHRSDIAQRALIRREPEAAAEETEIRFFNTLGRRLEPFRPVRKGQAGLYTCGPTVYNYAHIGNFRCYLFEDLLRRTLEYHGIRVRQIMNLTDVDDKTIRDSRAAGMKLDDFTAKYKKAFFEDVDTLRIERAAVYPEATKHIPEMIDMIRTLMKKGVAYQADDKSVYFSIAKDPEYGKLARIDMENQRTGERIANKNDEYTKDAVGDFALWKAWDEKDGDVRWDSPWGPGRPGWHIECSAMSRKYLGPTFDLHTGGIDNMFPHHEDEIAQSETANGCTFVNMWLHCRHLTVNHQKMSKSAGNFYTIRDLLAKGYTGDEIRWVLIGTHYRSELNFEIGALDQARTALRKFRDLFRDLAALPAGNAGLDAARSRCEAAKQAFGAAFAGDLNVAEALAEVFRFTRDVRAMLGSIRADAGKILLDQYRDFDRILAVLDVDASLAAAPAADDVPADVKALIEQRTAAKKARDFAAADAIRDQLKSMGWQVTDTPKGPKAEKL